MRYYEHSGTKSTVYVDDNGRKMIVKYGKRFASFKELKHYEYMVEYMRRKDAEVRDMDALLNSLDAHGERDMKYFRDEYRKAKGE